MRFFCLAAILATACGFTSQSGAFTTNNPSVGGRVFQDVVAPTSHRSRTATIVMGGKVNALRNRITSVKNTRKITMAMKLVAAAKVRRAQEAVLTSRPFNEVVQAMVGGLVLRLGKETLDLPLMKVREVKKVTIIVVTGDRGLCGGYNAYMIKKAETRYQELIKSGIACEVILVGKKAMAYFSRRKYPTLLKMECTQNPSAEMARKISTTIVDAYTNLETDAVELIYTKFVSLVASAPSVRTMVPLTASDITMTNDEIFQLTTKDGKFTVVRTPLPPVEPTDFPETMVFEQDPLFLLNSILPLYVNGQILRALQEAVASELAARMQSMQCASDNAGELAKNLSQVYNRARQAGVTQEILEIVAGAQALE